MQINLATIHWLKNLKPEPWLRLQMPALCLAFALIIGLLATACYNNSQMYRDIDAALHTSDEIQQEIGALRHSLLESASDCVERRICTLHFNVYGTRGCVRAFALVEESFPFYSVKSVSAETSNSILTNEAGQKTSFRSIVHCVT